MKTANLVVAALAATGVGLSAASAQQAGEGMITEINRLDGTIVIRPMDTVGANTAAEAERFKVRDASMLEPVHAGERVTYSVSENGGVKTITKLERQR